MNHANVRGGTGSFSSLFPFNEKTPGSVRRKTEGGIIVEADVKYGTPLLARKQSRARKCTHQNNFSAASRISFAAAKENVEIYAALP